VIEQALETAARMLGSGSSRAYCLEMICADFLCGRQHLGPNEVLAQGRFWPPAAINTSING
jgi:hypothetical protein